MIFSMVKIYICAGIVAVRLFKKSFRENRCKNEKRYELFNDLHHSTNPPIELNKKKKQEFENAVEL